MKNFFIALLFGISLMSMHTVSAATLALTETFGNPPTTSLPDGTQGVTGISTWIFVISGLGTGVTADIDLSTIIHGGFNSAISSWGFLNTDGKGLIDGTTYGLAFIIFPTTVVYDFSLAITNITNPSGGSNVPVPAAVWLFGSALMGLVGVACRKSQSVPLAA